MSAGWTGWNRTVTHTRGEVGVESSPGENRGSRAAIAIVAAALVLLSALLLIDVARAGTPRVYPARKQARTLLEIAELSGRVRAINPVIAIAAKEAGGPNTYLDVSEDYADLLSITPDNFNGKPTSTLNVGLMAPFIGGHVRKVDYDPILSQAKADQIESDPRAISLPRDVWALPGEREAQAVRVYTNPARTHIYVTSADLIQEGTE